MVAYFLGYVLLCCRFVLRFCCVAGWVGALGLFLGWVVFMHRFELCCVGLIVGFGCFVLIVVCTYCLAVGCLIVLFLIFLYLVVVLFVVFMDCVLVAFVWLCLVALWFLFSLAIWFAVCGLRGVCVCLLVV